MNEIPGLYQHLIDHSPIGTWVLTPDGTTVWFTPVLCTMLGRTPAELDGMPARVVFDVLGQEHFEAFLSRMRAGAGREPGVECLLYRPDGTTMWVMISSDTMETADGKLFVLRVSDHEGRRSLLDDLNEAQRLGHLGSWQVELATGEATWSPGMFHLVGRDPDLGPMLFDEFRDSVVEEDQSLLRADREAGRFTDEVRFRRPDGSVVWLRTEGRTVLDTLGGKPAMMRASAQDVTEHKLLELKLREAGHVAAIVRGLAAAANESATVASTFDLIHERMRTLDPSLRLVVFRPVVDDDDGSVTLVPGYPGRDTSWLTADEVTPIPLEVEIAHRAYLSQEMQVDGQASSGVFLVASNLMDDAEVVAIAVFSTANPVIGREGWREIAEAAAHQVQQVLVRERTNVALALARDSALEATRHKSQFLATMSHEIRTPINGVIGLNDLLLRTELDANQQRLAHGVKEAGHSLLTVINDILDVSKIEAGRLELESVDFELREVLDQALSLLGQHAGEKGIELAAEMLPDAPVFVRGDPVRLTQVVVNLVSNAVKFTPAGGEVIVRCALDPAAAEAVDASGADEVTLRFEVRDTGIGIAPENISRVFEAFTQAEQSTTRRFGGTGLGLPIAHQLVEAMGGQVGVDSELGVGSTFWFTSRFGVGDTTLISRTSVASTSHLLQGRRILVVDDSASNRRILAEILAGWQVQVESATGADEAVERIRRAAARGEAFDVALLDLVMPGRNGLELARLITDTTEGPWPTMLLLSSAGNVDKQQLDEAGIALNLTKPVGHSALFDGLVDALVGAHGLEAVAQPSAPRAGGTKLDQRILVVEDNEINQMVAQGVLDALGYDSEVAVDGVEAVEMAASSDYDAILMDVQMPNMDGYTATRRIREAETHAVRVPIIAMTAGAGQGEGQRCLDAGMDAYLTKPLHPDLLEETLKEHILGRARDRLEAAEPSPEAGMVLDPSQLEELRLIGPDAGPLVERIITRFVAGSQQYLTEIQKAVDDADFVELSLVAHTFRGSAATLGATMVSALCHELEQRGRAGDLTDAQELLESLDRAVERTLVLLRDELPQS